MAAPWSALELQFLDRASIVRNDCNIDTRLSLIHILSTVAFCLIHVAGYVGQEALSSLAVLALEYIPAGIALAWAYEKADTIFAPILMHAVINAVSIQALL